MTYDQLDRDSDALARGLAKQGVKKGDRVAVSLGNNLENATATYAIFKLGAILVRRICSIEMRSTYANEGIGATESGI